MVAHIRSAVGALAIDSYATQSVLTESELFSHSVPALRTFNLHISFTLYQQVS